MSAILNGNGSPIPYTDGTGAPANFKDGLPYENEGSIAVDLLSGITHYHQGLPFTANSRLASVLGGDVARFGNGAAPFAANERLLLTALGPDHYSSGVPYGQSSGVTKGITAV